MFYENVCKGKKTNLRYSLTFVIFYVSFVTLSAVEGFLLEAISSFPFQDFAQNCVFLRPKKSFFGRFFLPRKNYNFRAKCFPLQMRSIHRTPLKKINTVR